MYEINPELRTRREGIGGTLAQFAKILGVSHSTVARIEKGHVVKVDHRLALEIERLYGVPLFVEKEGKAS